MAGSIPNATQVELPLTLHPSRLQAWLFLPPSSLMLAIFLGMAMATGHSASWLLAGAFAFATAICVARVWPGVYLLHLTSDGFRVKTLFQDTYVAWRDVERFELYMTQASTSVSWQHATHVTVTPTLRGFHGPFEILPSNFGLRPKKLAALLNDLRQRYG